MPKFIAFGDDDGHVCVGVRVLSEQMTMARSFIERLGFHEFASDGTVEAAAVYTNDQLQVRLLESSVPLEVSYAACLVVVIQNPMKLVDELDDWSIENKVELEIYYPGSGRVFIRLPNIFGIQFRFEPKEGENA